MLRPFFVKGTHERSALGCPRRVSVQRAKNGGSGHSCRRSLMVPIMPRSSTQTAVKSYHMPQFGAVDCSKWILTEEDPAW